MFREISSAVVEGEFTKQALISTRSVRSSVLKPAPIHQLRPEILYQIFLILRDIWVDGRTEILWLRDQNAWNWMSVSQVCDYWRTTALDFPSLWNELLNFQNKQKTKVFLERSRDAQLMVLCDTRYSEPMDAQQRLESLFMALECSDRVRHLDVDITIHSSRTSKLKLQKLQAILSRPLPQLQVAKVQIRTEHSMVIPLRFSGSHLLRNLTLNNFSWTSNVVFPTGLLKLDLSLIKNLNIGDFLVALKACSDLEKLSIADVQWSTHSHSQLLSLKSSSPRVFLPNLVSLDIIFCETNNAVNEEIPRLIRITDKANWICQYTGIESWQSINILSNGFFNHLTKESVHCKTLKIFTLSCGFSIESDNIVDGSEVTSLSTIAFSSQYFAHPALVIGCLVSVIDACQWKGVTSVELMLEPINIQITEENWTHLFLAMPSIRQLTVLIIAQPELPFMQGSVCNSEPLLKIISSGTTPSAHDISICRDLKGLTVQILGEPVPKNFIPILSEGLQKRKDLGMILEDLLIHTIRPTEGLEKLSGLAKKFTYNG